MLVDLALSLPVMDTTRARSVLQWKPSFSSIAAINEAIEGIKEDAGMETPPLDPGAGGRFRKNEFATGVGERATPPSAS
jgi:hypothetical protein